MIRRLLVLTILTVSFAFATGCVSKGDVRHTSHTHDAVAAVHVSTAIGQTDGFLVNVTLYNLSEDYTGLIQEVRFDNGYVLVEWFHVAPGYGTRDHHVGPDNGSRTMMVYPADVEGIDGPVVDGAVIWAHLPENLDGSVKTNVGPNFNADYQRQYKTQGKVTRANREGAVFWRVDHEGDDLVVTIPVR